jgi:putative membrane protein
MKSLWIAIFTITIIWSGVNPKDQLTWFLEVAPALIGIALLAIS